MMMKKINIKNISWNLYCSYCGWNTLLLPDNERIRVGDKGFCRCCYEEEKNKKSVTTKDFFDSRSQSIERHEGFCTNMELETSVRWKFPKINVAHLYGELYKEDDMRLDLYYDEMNNKPYFRISIADDDDPWFGTETYCYVSVKQAIVLMNKNGIHYWDDMNESNWKNFFDFREQSTSKVSKIKEFFKNIRWRK